MEKRTIRSGLERDEFYANVNGDEVLIGTAEYDLNDAGVRLRVLEFADGMEAHWKEFEEKIELMPNDTLADKIAQTRLEVEFVEGIIADADAVFGADFCAKAIGPNCRNVLTLLEVLESIVTKYGAQPNMQIDRMVNATKNREQRRLSGKKR